MKLSMSLLAKYLRDYQPECHISEDDPTIKGVRFLSDAHGRRTNDYLYLSNASGYFHDEHYEDALILACGNNQIFCHGSDHEDLLNAVLSAFDYYGQLEQQLIIASSEHAKLQSMVDIAGQIWDSSILVFDLEGTLLASSHLDSLKEEIILSNIIKNNSLGAAAISQTLVDAQGRIHHDLTDYPQLLHQPDGKNPAVSMYIQKEEERLGFLMIFPTSHIEEQISLCYGKMLSEYLCKAYEYADKNSVYQAESQILSRLLAERAFDSNLVDKLKKRIKENASLLLFQSLVIQNKTLRHLVMQELKDQSFESISCDYDGYVAILVAKKDEKAAIQFLQERLPSSNLSIGISLPIPDLSELYIAYNQAHFALTMKEEAGIRHCSDLALPFLLQILQKDQMACQMRHPAVSILQKYDQTNHTDLYLTLESYLVHGCHQNETALDLHIHLNSLKYRLKRIEELTGIDFKNHEELLYLQLSIKI